MTLRAAVIGIGNKGWAGWGLTGLYPQELTHVGAVMMSSLELVAVVDKNESLLQTFVDWVRTDYPEYQGGVYTDFEKMLTEAKPDVVIIATPVETHYRIARIVPRFECVKAVLLEKPIASTLKEATDIVKTYEYFKVPCIINHSRRWNPAWLKVKDAVDKLGGCIHITGYGNGETLDAGVHMADLMNMLAPEAVETGKYRYVDLYDPAMGKYQPYLLFEVLAVCRKGYVLVSGNGRTIHGVIGTKTARYRDLMDTTEGIRHFDPARDDAVSNLLAVRELVSIVETGAKPSCTPSDGLKALEMTLKWVEERA